jgi:hypothetical protein
MFCELLVPKKETIVERHQILPHIQNLEGGVL